MKSRRFHPVLFFGGLLALSYFLAFVSPPAAWFSLLFGVILAGDLGRRG